MSNQALAVAQDATTQNIYESLALRGDISALNPQDKTAYLKKLCDSLGMNPYTQPFIPLKLNGKEILYASRGATDQLASINKLTREIIKTERIEDVFVATCKVTAPDGRFDISTGAVTIGNLKGDALCNALMKAETKAKRRATLSFCGLVFLDETELETIPREKIEYVKTPTKGQLTQTAQSEPSADAPNHSVDEMAMREQIHKYLTAAKVKPENTLKKFDSLETAQEKISAVENTLKFVVAGGIAGQNWDADEIDIFLNGFGIESGLDSATNEQMETIFKDLLINKMF